MSSEDRHFLLKQNDDVVVAFLNLATLKDKIAVLSARPETLLFMEEAIKECGFLPKDWMPTFYKKLTID